MRAFVNFTRFLLCCSAFLAAPDLYPQTPNENCGYPRIRTLRAEQLLRGESSEIGFAFPVGKIWVEGDTHTFLTINLVNNTSENTPATLRKRGNNCYIWVADDQWPPASTRLGNSIADAVMLVGKIADEFDMNIYSTDRAFFGTEPNVDGDARIHILLFNINDGYAPPNSTSYTAGYFDPSDQTGRNNLDLFYMDVDPATAGSTQFYGTLAHEFQHMIHYNMDSEHDEDAWLDEGLAEYAVKACGYGLPLAKIGFFAKNPDLSLADDFNSTLAEYGASFLFVEFMTELVAKAGQQISDFTLALVDEDDNGIDGINTVAASFLTAAHDDFTKIFASWIVANFSPRAPYGYTDPGINFAIAKEEVILNPPTKNGQTWSNQTVNSWAADYFKVTPQPVSYDISVSFNGELSGISPFDDFNPPQILVIKNNVLTGNIPIQLDAFNNGEYVISLRAYDSLAVVVSGEDDGGDYSLAVNVAGVDIALVIDRSGSMAGTKIAAAKTAANTFVDVMQDGDKIAVTSFSSGTSVNYPLTTIAGATTKTAAKNAINGLAASGGTSIGGGMQVGQSELNKGDPNHPHAMLLLSDGMENTSPYVADILPTIPAKTDIYTIGLGADVDPTQLQSIANTTGGTYTPAPSSADLQEIYLRIQGQIKGQQTTSSFTGMIAQGQTATHTTTLDALTSLASFSMTFQGSDVDLELVAPNGSVINPQVALTDPNITYIEGATLDSYTITQPQAGTWTLRILGVDVPVPETYFAIVQVNSTLKIQTAFNKSSYEAGEPILISANLQANGQPIGNATVTANVDAPTTSMLALRQERAAHNRSLETGEETVAEVRNSQNGAVHEATAVSAREDGSWLASSLLNLFDDGLHGDGAANDGVYANYFTNTINDGSYTFTIQASGIASPGGAFVRESVLSTVVTPSSRLAVVSITPNTGQQGQTQNVTITGVNFASGAAVSFGGTGITVNSSTFVNSTQLAANLTVAVNAPLGPRDVIVTNPDGQSATGPALFAITGCAANVFFDEFADQIADGWLPNLAWRWHILSVENSFAYCVDVANPAGDEYSILNQSKLGDFVLDVKAKALATSNKNFFILFGVQDFTNSPEDSYYLRFGGGNNGVTLFRSVAGNGVPIASAPDNFADDNKYHVIRIERRGANIQVFGDQRLLINVNDATHATGHIGFGSYQSTACFDNVQVSGCPDLPAGPVVFATYNIDDDNGGASNGDGDGRPESGESVELTMALTNRGARHALDVSAILSTTDPDVTILDDNNIWPNIAPGATAASWSNFGFRVNPTLPQDKDVNFVLTVLSSNAGPWAQTFPIRVYAQNTPAVIDLVADRVFLRTAPNSGTEVTNPVAGQQYYVHLDWRNVGAIDANGFRFEIKLNGAVICAFNGASAPGNSIHNSYCDTPVTWPAGGGVLHGALDVYNQVTEAVKNNNNAYRTYGYQSFTDFDLTAQVRSTENFNNNAGADLCFVYGYQDDRHYYYAMFNRFTGETRVYKVRDNDRILVGDLGTFIIPDNNYHTVRLVRSAGNLQVFWDNVLLGSVTNDLEYGAGGLGVGSFNDTGIFDDICVKPLGGANCIAFDNFEDGNANGWLPLNPSRWDVILDGGDFGYRINDTNYENLEYLRLGEYSLLAPSGQADLVAQRIYLRAAPNTGADVDTAVAGQSYYVHFDWQNLGTATANNVPVEIRLNGVVQCVATVSATPGESKTTVCNTPIVFNPGNYFFQASVDVGNLVNESNENNNSIARTYVVASTCQPTVCTGPAIFPVPQGSKVVGTPILGRNGSTVCVDIRVQNNTKAINAFGFQVQVNPAQLAFKSASAGDLTGGFTLVNASETPAGSGRIICGGFGSTGIPANSAGVLIRLCFTVTCATGQASAITINSLADDVAGMTACCNTFTCSSCLHDGDVSGDGTLTPGDAFCAFNIFLNGGNVPASCEVANSTCEADASDVNCDGAVTPGDAFAIFTRYLQNLPPLDCFAKTALAKQNRPYQLSLQQSHVVLSNHAEEELLKLTLRVDNPVGLRALGLQLAYPHDQLEPLAVQRTALTAKWMKLEGQNAAPGKMFIGGFDTQELPAGDSAALLEVLFKKKARNVSPAEFELSDFVDDLSAALAQSSTEGQALSGNVPKAFQLHQNFPNPFAAQTTGNVTMIRFELPGSEAIPMELAIYNLAGQLVRRLLAGTRSAGAYEIAWDGNDEAGNAVPSGTYLYRLKAGKHVASKSLVVVR